MRVECSEPLVTEALADLWSPFGSATGKSTTGITVEEGSDFWETIDRTSNLIFRAAIAGLKGHLDVHAGVVQRGDSVLLFPGAPGVGKTTLTLELLSREGWAYASDDLAPIDVSTQQVSAMPKPLSVKDPARWMEFMPRWELASTLPVPRHLFLVPASLFEVVDGSSLTPTHVFFPRRVNGTSRLQEVSRGQALYRVGELVSQERMTPEALTSLNGLSKRTRLAEVTYEEAYQGADLIESVLGP